MSEINSGQTSGESSKGDKGSIRFTSDPSQIQITNVKFNVSHYLTWSKSVLIYVQGKDKEEYLTREIEMPLKSDTRSRRWKMENATLTG